MAMASTCSSLAVSRGRFVNFAQIGFERRLDGGRTAATDRHKMLACSWWFGLSMRRAAARTASSGECRVKQLGHEPLSDSFASR